jgi:hypothetical protein
MRAEPGSDAWKGYWKDNAAQAEYRAALEGLQASTDALSGLAGGGARLLCCTGNASAAPCGCPGGIAMATQYDRLIDTLTTDPADRIALKAVASGLDTNPFAAGRVEAIIHQLAQPAVKPDGTPFTGEESLAYMTDFATVIGIPPDVVTPALYGVGDVDIDEISTEAIEDQGLVDHVEASMKADPVAYSRSSQAQDEYRSALERLNTRQPESSYWTDTDDRRLTEIESKYMRAEPGSQAWREYWQGGLQAEYGDLLARKMAPPAMPAAEPEVDLSIE